MYEVKQSTALTIPVFAHDVNGDSVTGMVDAGFTKRISKASGAFAAMTVTITEMENGWYSVPLSTAHTDTLGVLSITFTNASSKQINLQFRVAARIADDLAFPATSGRSMVVDAAGLVDANMVKAGATGAGNTITTTGGVTLPAATLASTTNITGGTITTVTTTTTATNLTNLPSIPANWLTAAGTATDFGTELATAIWTDTTAADFTAALSIGKSVMNGVALGTGLTVNAVTGLTASNLDTTVSSRMATYTQPTGFLAATFPTGTIANTTNITAGTITTATTATNLTNLPSIPANWITAAGITAAALNGKGDWMVSYTQPTGFLAATFPTGTVANTTNITAGTIATATNLTNLPSIPANWITAAGITAAAMNGKGDWNIGKTGYSLTQTFPTNFSASVITVGGIVSANVKQVNDITVTGAGTAGSPWGP